MLMAKLKKKNDGSVLRASLTGVMLVILVIVVVDNWPQISQSLGAIRGMSLLTVWLMIAAYAASIVFAAWTYYILALKKIKFSEVGLVEAAAASVNRVLPAGTGTLGLHTIFLMRRKHSAPQATAVVGVNNVIGIVEHFAVLGLLMLIFGRGERVDWNISVPSYVWWGLLASIAVFAAVMAIFPRLRRRVLRFMFRFEHVVVHFRDKPKKIMLATFAAFLLTVSMFVVFSLSVCAFGVKFDLVPFFIVFTFGVVVGIAMPTPGGVGGVEAGTTAGLLAYGVATTPALAAALTFRLITYWLPLVAGAPAFFVARHRKLV